MMRLNKYLAHAGIASRRKCDDLILAGEVAVNGKKIDRVGVTIDETKDKVTYKGKNVSLKEEYIYILLNKPRGVVTTAHDEFKRDTVLDLIGIPERIFPVGRLDYETTGVLLLTNDGDLSNHLLHPNYKVSKTYRAMLDRVIRPVDLHKLRKGVLLDDQMTQPCTIEELRIVHNCSLLQIELKEGRNRQIRRMFELFNYTVEDLERLSFAGLTAKDLDDGHWRYLSTYEVDALKDRVHYHG